MLTGAPARESLGPAEQEIFAEGALGSEALVRSGRRHDLAWSSMLADVVDADRGESVGGTLRPRPAVAAR
jgi:hypothetical protein